MLVRTMSYQEIRREIEKDIPYLTNSIDSKISKLRRILIKNHKQSIIRSFFVNSPRRTRYMFVIEYLKKNDPNIMIAALFEAADETKVIAFHLRCSVRLVIYRRHFFYRYAERTNLGLARFEDIVSHFFLKNPAIGVSLFEEEAVFSFLDGFGLGIMNEPDNVLYVNTFLSKSMLFENQTEIRDNTLNRLKKVVEESCSPRSNVHQLFTNEDKNTSSPKGDFRRA